MNSKLLPLTAVFAAVLTDPSHAAAPPAKPEPLRGAIASGRVLACVPDGTIFVSAWSQPLRGGRAAVVKNAALHFAGGVPVRWHASHGALWLASSLRGWGRCEPGNEALVRYELSDLLQGRLVSRAGTEPLKKGESSDFVVPWPLLGIRFRSSALFVEFRTVTHYDYLPAGSDAALLLVITNVSPREKWSFTGYHHRGRWSAEAARWFPKQTEEFTLELAFNEPFQALARGEDYYFLTASGRLYRAPKPATGKHRKLEVIRNDERSPVTAFVTDVDRDRTFLFCDKGPKGKGGPFVFELGSGVRPRFYEPKLFKRGDQGPTALRRVVGYARILDALGYVKDAAKTSNR
jgi:hypothetical protein